MNRSNFAKTVALSMTMFISTTALIAAPLQAHALGKLGSFIPGARTSNAASIDPDTFLAETIETTKMMMISAEVLHHAARKDGNRETLRSEIKAIEGISDIGELNTKRESFSSNMEAVALNYKDAEAIKSKYDSASADQQKLLLSAAYNFSLAMVRNVQLTSQAPDLMKNMMTNPALLRRAGSIMTAGGLLALQAKEARSMVEPLGILLSRGGVKPPTDAQAGKPRPISL
jgi:hypothetical protein